MSVAQELDPADPDTPVAVASALAQAGFPQRAGALLRARLGRSPGDPNARRALAEIALSTARPEAALAALSGARPVLAASASDLILLGDARVVAGDRAGAREAYRRAVALEPESAAAHDRLGRLALAARQWAEAKQELAAARDRDPGESAYGCRLAQAYWGAGQREDAERLWEELAAGGRGYAPAHVALGKLYLARKELAAAAAHLVAAVQADASSKEAQFTLAEVMTAQGDRASAAYQRGIYYLETDRPHLALSEFRKIETLAPDRADGPRMTALAYTRMKRLDLAAAETQRGLARHPGSAGLLGQLGLLHILGRNRPRATQLCEQWRKQQPHAAEPYRLLARIAREEQRFPDALQLAEQAFARDPQDALVCAELAKDLAALGGEENNRRAAEIAQRATDLNPRETDFWQQFGVCLQSVNREADAADAYLRALDLDPSSLPSCNALLAIAARQRHAATSRLYASLVADLQSRHRTGDLLWRVVYRHPDDPTAHERLARFLLDSADPRRAAYQLDQLAILRPTDAAVHRDLARIELLLDLR